MPRPQPLAILFTCHASRVTRYDLNGRHPFALPNTPGLLLARLLAGVLAIY